MHPGSAPVGAALSVTLPATVVSICSLAAVIVLPQLIIKQTLVLSGLLSMVI